LQQPGHGLLTGGLQPFDGQRFKQRRELARRLRPRQFDHSYTVVPAFAPRRLGVQNRLILTRVQVPPLPLRLMIVQPARRSAFRARPFGQVVMAEANVDLSGLQFQLHRVHEPGSLNA
jgi:hypothetical protein